ncbi:MAG: PQQ-binding-like beta-propeller repeat protein [Gemmatimonadota bacterium]
MIRRTFALLLLAPLACQNAVQTPASNDVSLVSTTRDPRRTWLDYGGSQDQSKYVAFKQLTKANVSKLRVAWIYSTADSSQYQFNPIIVDSVMYVVAKNNSLVALNAATGKEIWIHANLRGMTRRGMNYWESVDRRDRRLLFTLNSTLQAIDATTGKSILTFGRNGTVDLRDSLGRDPNTISRVQSGTPGRIFEDLILLGSSTGEDYFSTPGHIRAYNVITGEVAWTFHTIPQPGEFGYDTWPKDAWKYAGGVNTWGEITLDAKRGIAYFPVGSPTYDYYGADRTGANLFGSSLLALDARTGKRLWHFQFVHHDLWDYDPTAAPQLITVTKDGRSIDAVAQATKQGFLFVFDRVTGTPVWPIAERAVPPSDVPGEHAWPTQPFPSVLPPFARQTFTSNMLTPIFLSEAERVTWTKRIDAARKGLFNPPSLTQETVSVPGAVGGSNWGNTAADPERGIVYVLNQDFPSFYRLEKRAAARDRDDTASGNGTRGAKTFATNCENCHGARGVGDSGPALSGSSASRLSMADFRFIVSAGGAQMPAFAHLDDETIRDIYTYLGGNASGPAFQIPVGGSMPPSGPVVATGGAPRPPASGGGRGQGAARPGYPAGVEAPASRYSTDYGLGHPYIMAPPWSTLIAYDLNRSTIKWKVPIGQDLRATEAGAKNTGVPRGTQRNGMVVTSTGLVFSTAKDGHVYAFDADNGKVLWTGQLPMGTEGLPAMYEINGKVHLVVNATTPLTWGRRSRESGIGADGPRGGGGYVVFTLP